MCSPDLQDFSACRSRTTNLCDGKTCSWEGLGAVCSPKPWLEAKTLVLKVKWLNLIPCQESNSSNNSTKTNIICIRFRSVEMFYSSLWIGNGVTALPFPQQSFKDHGLLVAMSVCYLSSPRPLPTNSTAVHRSRTAHLYKERTASALRVWDHTLIFGQGEGSENQAVSVRRDCLLWFVWWA